MSDSVSNPSNMIPSAQFAPNVVKYTIKAQH